MNQALAQKYKRVSHQSRDQLILDHVKYVAKILSTMDFTVTDADARENLHSAGILGLVEAANKFDATKGIAFSTFAYPRIRGAIVDELRSLQPVSQLIMNRIGIVRGAYQVLEPPVTPEQLAEHSGLTLEQVVECLEALRFIKPDDWNDMHDVVHGSWRHSADSPAHAAEANELTTLLAQAIEDLSEQERLVVTLYHSEDLNLAEIGSALDRSESWVSRTLATARFRIQEAIRCKTK